MPRVLALDTATQACTVALSGEAVTARHELLARAHNRHILRMVSELLLGRSLTDAVDVIACGVGPGSFTGLRVAVSVAQGLAWSQGLPVHGFCSLTAQVYAAADQQLLRDGDWVLSAIDAQIDQLYGLWGLWRHGRFEPRSDAFISTPEHLPVITGAKDAVIVGSAAHYVERFPEGHQVGHRYHPQITPDAGVMVQVLGTDALPLELGPAHGLSPQYVQRDIGWKKVSEQGRHD
jgi:tRNA threonylcarbamoyladenosine biosynthesis protein TsaB